MIENALFMRVREKDVLNGVQMEYSPFLSTPIWQLMIVSSFFQNGIRSDGK
jgi:hypothetical protein